MSLERINKFNFWFDVTSGLSNFWWLELHGYLEKPRADQTWNLYESNIKIINVQPEEKNS